LAQKIDAVFEIAPSHISIKTSRSLTSPLYCGFVGYASSKPDGSRAKLPWAAG